MQHATCLRQDAQRVVAERQHADADGGVERFIVKREAVSVCHLKGESAIIGVHGEPLRHGNRVELDADTHHLTTTFETDCAGRPDQRREDSAVHSTSAAEIEYPLAGLGLEQVEMSLELRPGGY